MCEQHEEAHIAASTVLRQLGSGATREHWGQLRVPTLRAALKEMGTTEPRKALRVVVTFPHSELRTMELASAGLVAES